MMSGLLERIAQTEQVGFVVGQHDHLRCRPGLPAGVKPAGRQIDGSQVCAAISVLVGKPSTGQRPLRSSSRVGGSTWHGGKQMEVSRLSWP